MKTLWSRLETWATTHAKRSLHLRPGNPAKAIAAAEKAMKLAFPPDFRESLALHDGQDGSDDTFEWLPGCSPLVSLKAIVAQWKDERGNDDDGEVEPYDAQINQVIFHPRRIPIAGNPFWDGDNTYLDLIPAKKGTSGQVVMFTSECDMAVMGTSFRDALERYLRALESGAWVFDQRKGHVTPKGRKSPDHPNRSEAFASWPKKRR